MDHYVQYHNSDLMGKSCLDFKLSDGFRVFTRKPVSNLIGNRVWLIGGINKPRLYYLCYTFIVDSVENTWDEYVVSGENGTFLQNPILLNHLPWFHEFLHNQQNFSLGFRKIEKEYAERLENLIFQKDEDFEQMPNSGGGFGLSESNRLVEEAAIHFVKEYYLHSGWSVRSFESQKCGYDLKCVNGDVEEHVEVKGIQGNIESFILTKAEEECSRNDPNYVFCVVTAALSQPQLHRYTAGEFHRAFDLRIISYHASRK